MSKTSDLDRTIDAMNTMLEGTKARKDKLAIIDRLIRAYGLKYKHSDDGKGGKFNSIAEEGDTDG